LFATAVSLAGCGEDASSSAASAGGSGGTPSGGSGPGGGAGGGAGNAGGAGGDDPIGGGGGGGNTGPTMSPGCTSGSGLAEGEHVFTLDDLERRFIVRLPIGYTADQPWPVVLALHGNGGSVAYWDVTSGPRNIRAVLENDAVLIIVEAIEGNWRDYDMPPETWPARIEQELAYFEEVLTQAKNELCIHEDAIFSMGFSGGGSFSGVLGCRRPDIRAIAVGGSVIYFEEEDCAYAPAAWITIGEMELSPAREAFRDFFRDRAMCEETSMATDPSPCTAYDGCAPLTPVHYCQHPAGHVWPDFGSEAMWSFFSTFVE
jgi:polyhydroxybutyrate depolymerase